MVWIGVVEVGVILSFVFFILLYVNISMLYYVFIVWWGCLVKVCGFCLFLGGNEEVKRGRYKREEEEKEEKRKEEINLCFYLKYIIVI